MGNFAEPSADRLRLGFDYEQLRPPLQRVHFGTVWRDFSRLLSERFPFMNGGLGVYGCVRRRCRVADASCVLFGRNSLLAMLVFRFSFFQQGQCMPHIVIALWYTLVRAACTACA